MKIETIHQSIYGGIKGINHALDVLDSNIPDELLEKLDAALDDLKPRFLNYVAKSPLFKRHFRKVLDGEKAIDPNQGAKYIAREIEEELNDRIIATKKSDSRHNRTKEKAMVMRVLRQNKDQIKAMVEFYNLLVKAKHQINTKNDP